MKPLSVEMRLLRAALLLAAGLALAGCQTDSTGKPEAKAAPAAPAVPDHQQAALDCWMETEHGHADLPLDKRADVVDACIKAKMAGKPWPAEAAAKAQTKRPSPRPKRPKRARRNRKPPRSRNRGENPRPDRPRATGPLPDSRRRITIRLPTPNTRRSSWPRVR